MYNSCLKSQLFALRSSVGDIPAIIASILPDCNAGTSPSHSVFTITNSFPNPSAIFFAISTSYPPAYSAFPSILLHHWNHPFASS